MKNTDNTITSAIEDCDNLISKMKYALIVSITLLFLLIGYNVYRYNPESQGLPILTTTTAIKFEMAKGLIVDMTVAELLEYTVAEKWKYDMADEGREN